MTTATPDFTFAEARAAFKAFTANVGPKCTCSVHLQSNAQVLDLEAYFQPTGQYQDGFFILTGNTFREVLAACETKWSEVEGNHAVKTIREMALKIISLTADHGECTDAALRAEFDAVDVAQYGERACTQATEMASNGPFSIVKLSGANDAVAA